MKDLGRYRVFLWHSGGEVTPVESKHFSEVESFIGLSETNQVVVKVGKSELGKVLVLG